MEDDPTFPKARRLFSNMITRESFLSFPYFFKEIVRRSSDRASQKSLRSKDISDYFYNASYHPKSRMLIDTSLADPKTVVVKSESQQSPKGIWKYPLNADTLQRRIRILSFGRSHTWGAQLEDRENQAYPFMLREPNGHVYNAALRATGADYPSVCLQSMLPNSDLINFDVITLEFHPCGDAGFELLLKRLRDRYPDAIIILVFLWNLLEFVYEKESGMTPRKRGKDPNIDWTFIEGKPCSTSGVVELAEKYGAYVYRLPETPRTAINDGWFSSDWFHPSSVGHLVITNGILDILSNHQDELFKDKRLGSFGLGDQCMSWYQDGGKGLSVKIDGVNIEEKSKLLGPVSKKYAVEIDMEKGGRITFESQHDDAVPVGIMHMSMQEGKRYTLVKASINDQDPVSVDPNINPHENPSAHTSMLHQIGFAQKGMNTISIHTVEAREKPFMVTGIVLCGVCAETGKLGNMLQSFVNFDSEG